MSTSNRRHTNCHSLKEKDAGTEEETDWSDHHSISVSLPSWSSVIGYEEADISTMRLLRSGYPRFFRCATVRRIEEHVLELEGIDERGVLLTPSYTSALRARSYITGPLSNMNPEYLTRVSALPCGVYAVTFPGENAKMAERGRKVWQHVGDIVSSRRAEDCLKMIKAICGNSNTAPDCTEDTTQYEKKSTDIWKDVEKLENRIRSYYPNSEGVHLCPSGMSSISKSFRAAQALRPGGKIIVFGFPYLDTLKIVKEKGLNLSGEYEFYPDGGKEDILRLAASLRKWGGSSVSCVITEFPTNPLLKTIDLCALSEITTSHSIPLIVDDTIGGFHNLDLTKVKGGGVSMVATSLTKLFSGASDVIAGSCIVLKGEHGEGLERVMEGDEDEKSKNNSALYHSDVTTLLRNSEDYGERQQEINRKASKVVKYLRSKKAIGLVDDVYYCDGGGIFDKYLRKESPGVGFGGLVSFCLSRERLNTPVFYDALRMCKGPSLGTNFSLCMPYTMLAHYNELKEVEKLGVRRDLLRISIGCDDGDEDDLPLVLEEAFESARVIH